MDDGDGIKEQDKWKIDKSKWEKYKAKTENIKWTPYTFY